MTKESPQAVAKRLQEQLSSDEQKLINQKVLDQHGFLNFISDCKDAGCDKEIIMQTVSQTVDNFFHLSTGEGSDPERSKGVILMGLRNQMAAQIIMAKEEQNKQKPKPVN